ncbi:MAG: plasma-membrane proton-efflux P-type ATPase [Pseudomonadota bacterium]
MDQVAAAAPKAGNAQSTDPAKKTLTAEEIAAQLSKLKTTAQGLSAADAAQRLRQDGPNAITAKEEPLWHKLVGYFWGPIPWMIEAAAVISLARQDWPDFLVVTALLVYNAAVGFWQDAKAANALKSLRSSLARQARVRRDGSWANIPAEDLVTGDVIEVRAGEIVPADLLLLNGAYLQLDESALTGESLPVGKGVGNAAYAGSIAKQGAMEAVVTATSDATFFGKTASLVASASSKSHSQRAVMQIGDALIALAAALALVLIGAEVYRTMVVTGDFSWDAVGALTQFVLVLLVAAIPVALPAVMSVTLALGALTLSREKAIVSRLSAIDELAGVDILCSDKTGTLTQNKIALSEPVPYGDATATALILAAARATKGDSDDAIDHAVLNAVEDRAVVDTMVLEKFVPFDPVSKRTMATRVDDAGSKILYAKGAPQAVSSLCPADPDRDARYSADVARLAAGGYRALGVAQSDDGGETWVLLGLLSLIDPPREDASDTIRETKALGLDVKMITGDDVAIGSEIAGRLGMGTRLLLANDVFDKDTDPDHIPIAAARAVEKADGFGRVFPRHKFEIVKSLQECGHIVAMTGDGVNDAPALKQADCGIAVSGATDAARSAAALVLTAPGLSTIVNAIVEARKIFERILSYIYYRIAMTIAIMAVVVLSSLVFGIQPLTPVMIVALALLDDIPIMTIAYDNVKTAPQPVRWDMHRILYFSGIMGFMAALQSFGIVLIGMAWMQDASLNAWFAIDKEHLQTILFLQLAAGGHLLLFVVRSRGWAFSKPLPSPPLFIAVVATQVLAVIMCANGILVPALPWEIIGLVWLYIIAATAVTDIVKRLVLRHHREPSATALTDHHLPLA